MNGALAAPVRINRLSTDLTAAKRQARARRRARLGLRRFVLELDEIRVVETLLDAGLISDHEALDPNKVERELRNLVDAEILSRRDWRQQLKPR